MNNYRVVYWRFGRKNVVLFGSELDANEYAFKYDGQVQERDVRTERIPNKKGDVRLKKKSYWN